MSAAESAPAAESASPVKGSRIVLIACLVTAASITVLASTSYLIQPISDAFNLSSTMATTLKFIPSLAAILVVFVGGVLGDRIGKRRTILGSTILFAAGAVLTLLAPEAWVAVIGLSVLGASVSVMSVVSISLLSASITGKDERAKAFGTLGLVSPLVYLVAPIVAGSLVTWGTWRMVALLWVLMGVAVWLFTRHMLPKDPPNPQAGELLTPILGGVALVLATQVISRASKDGITATITLVTLGALVVCLIGMAIAYRTMHPTTLSLAPLRRISAVLLLIVVIIGPLMALWYTTHLGFEYLFGLTPVQISIIMIPSEIAGMLGAKLIPHVIIKRSLMFAGIVVFVLFALCQLSFYFVGVDGMWVMVALITIYGLLSSCIAVVMSNAVMDSVPSKDSGAISSYRSAAGTIGSALASIVVGVIVLGTYHSSLDAQAGSTGMSSQQVDQIATALTKDQTTTDPTAQSGATDEQVAQVSDIQKIAMVDSLHAKAGSGAVLALASGAIFVIAMRRRKPTDEVAAKPATSSRD